MRVARLHLDLGLSVSTSGPVRPAGCSPPAGSVLAHYRGHTWNARVPMFRTRPSSSWSRSWET